MAFNFRQFFKVLFETASWLWIKYVTKLHRSPFLIRNYFYLSLECDVVYLDISLWITVTHFGDPTYLFFIEVQIRTLKMGKLCLIYRLCLSKILSRDIISLHGCCRNFTVIWNGIMPRLDIYFHNDYGNRIIPSRNLICTSR